jgi:cryptochrome
MGLSSKNGSHYHHKHPKQQQNATQKPKEKHSVHWFRKGLRLHDNPALIYALKNAKTFRCVFVIDPWFAGSMELNLTKHCSNVGINKWR